MLAGLLVLAVMAVPSNALAVGPNAVLYPTGWNTNAVTRGDDTSNLVVGLPFTMNWMGTSYTQVSLNMNGSITFVSPGLSDYTPNALSGVGQAIIASLWEDVDTRYVGTPNQRYYSNLTAGSIPTVNGRPAVLMTWSNVIRYNGTTQSQDTTNTFQLVLIDRSDTGAGNFDFMFDYDKVVWDTGTASAGYPARAGWATATGQSFELPGSGTTGALFSGVHYLAHPELAELWRAAWQIRVAGA